MKQREIIKTKIKAQHGCVGYCEECNKKTILIDKMNDSNIPAEYWRLSIDTFPGSQKLKEVVIEYISKLEINYAEGRSLCFVGGQGVGKTAVSVSILKAALKRNFSSYYISAHDMLSEFVDFKNNHRIKEILRSYDFIVVDELDSRFFTSDSTKELFGGIFENVFRHRAQNLLPTIICSNETGGLSNVFLGQSQRAIESLFSKYLETIPVMGQDIRRKNGKQ